MSTTSPEPSAAQKGAVKAYIASLTGTSLEYYDFALYSVASALVFPHVFFPAEDPFIGLLLSFSTFAVGYFARPIGGVVFGRLGDRIGRKNVLVATLLLIGVATVLIGVLPSYGTIGVIAPTILVLLRFAQGVGLFVTGVGLVLHLAGVPWALPIAAALAFVAAFLNAAFGLCLGCQLYLLLQRGGLVGRAA